MLKPYVGAIVHYIPMTDGELRCETCDQPRAAMITRIHSDLDVDLNVFTSKVTDCVRVRTSVPYALMSDKAPHWRWVDTRMLGETVQDPEKLREDAPDWAKRSVQIMAKAPLQDTLRALIPGRGKRDRLLLERWAKALEGHLVDTSVVFNVDKDGSVHVGIDGETPGDRAEVPELGQAHVFSEEQPRVFPDGFVAAEGGEDSKTTRQGEQV